MQARLLTDRVCGEIPLHGLSVQSVLFSMLTWQLTCPPLTDREGGEIVFHGLSVQSVLFRIMLTWRLTTSSEV